MNQKALNRLNQRLQTIEERLSIAEAKLKVLKQEKSQALTSSYEEIEGKDNPTIKDIMILLNGGHDLQAMKHVREQTGWGLKEAKDLVECIKDLNNTVNKKRKIPIGIEGPV